MFSCGNYDDEYIIFIITNFSGNVTLQDNVGSNASIVKHYSQVRHQLKMASSLTKMQKKETRTALLDGKSWSMTSNFNSVSEFNRVCHIKIISILQILELS